MVLPLKSDVMFGAGAGYGVASLTGEFQLPGGGNFKVAKVDGSRNSFQAAIKSNLDSTSHAKWRALIKVTTP